jgi:pimeloyl-ACP methyl ester carboxylesterase
MKTAGRVAAAVVSAGIMSFTYQRIAEAHDRRRLPPPGRLVDIGGRRLHMITAGAGSPGVIIIPAVASTVLGWLRVQREAAAKTTVCVYDRAGIGWSDPPQYGQLTPDAMAADLRALLDAAAVEPPYVLAGHSFGGIIARRFQARYPDMVAGMLLIDSSHEEQARRLPAADWRETAKWRIARTPWLQATILGARRLAAGIGLLRGLDTEAAREAPAEYASQARAIILSSRHKQIAAREMLLLAQTWGQPLSLGSLPLTVLTSASRPWRGYSVWAQLQDELATLSSDSRHVTSRKAGHLIHLDEPELVVRAICDLVNRCRPDTLG